MLAARLVCLRALSCQTIRPTITQASPALRNSNIKAYRLWQPNQCYATRVRTGVRRGKIGQEIKEAAFEPSAETALKGRVALSVVFLVGLYFDVGNCTATYDWLFFSIWPQYVKDRIHSTYMYFAGSIGLTALSAVAVSRSPALMSLMTRGSWLAIGATFAAMIGAGMLVRSISYEDSPAAKHLAWMMHSGVMGAVVAPLAFLGGPLLIRAAWYTAGIVGGLSTVAMCAPSEKFLNMGGPLGIGLGFVLASSIGSMFLPPTSAFGAGLYSVAVYGGLVLFGMFLLYDTQHVIKRAETIPYYGVTKYDPINACMGIYTDTLNIFIRVATMLAGGGGGRRK
uniref:Growth hormone inducible transmembrane protein n=1 Tax=Strix occidentalis caurina TaxID=311401 RepID=A0A8D0KW59_STROC